MLLRERDIGLFAASAKPGDRVTYGRGEHPPREMVRAMRPYVDAGVLSPVSKREGGEFLFMVERARGSAVLPSKRSQPRVRRGRSPIEVVFDCLARTARAGAPCPTNEELGRKCGLAERSARYRLQQLASRRWISVSFDGPFGRRVIEILHGPHAGARTMEAV